MRPEELEEPEGMEEQEYPEGFKEVFDTQYKRILDYAKILFGDAPGTVSGRGPGDLSGAPVQLGKVLCQPEP